MAGQTVIDHVILLDMFHQGRLEIRHVLFLAVGETLQDGRRIVNSPHQLDLRDVELFRGLQEDIPGDTFVTQLRGHLFGHFFTPAVGTPGNGDN